MYNNKIREDFVKFIDACESITTTVSQDQDNSEGEQDSDPVSEPERRLTGEAIGNIVLKFLQELSLDPKIVLESVLTAAV